MKTEVVVYFLEVVVYFLEVVVYFLEVVVYYRFCKPIEIKGLDRVKNPLKIYKDS